MENRRVARAFGALTAAVSLAALVEPAAAHAGTTHAGTPHAVLLVLVLAGVAGLVGGWRLFRGGRRGVGAASLAAGLVLALFGSIGLVEIQVAPQAAPAWNELFDPLSVLVGSALALGSLVVVRWRWPERLRYVGLGLLLAAWIAYPAVMHNSGYTHPLGYLIVLGVPVAVAYILARDGGQRIATALDGRRPRLAAGVTFVVFAVFFAFSAGSLTLNPDTTPAIAGEGFVTLQRVASPLVYWPAVEFYAPSIPAAGYISLGTVLLVALLGGLVALNVGLAVRQVQTTTDADSPRAMLGAVAASGATACCCCAPALYGVVGAAFGAAASPVYWAFMDPTSPVGGLFLAASVLLLTGSTLRSADDVACAVR